MSFASGLKTIVVAMDLRRESGPRKPEAALDYARKLAAAYGARIVLAHGLDPAKYAAVEGVPRRLLHGMTEEARTALAALRSELLIEGIHSHSELRQGAVARMLADVARQYEAGLIVIGTAGQEGAGPVLVGSVAEELVRLSPCPVLAVAADWNAGEFRPTPGGPVLLAMKRNEATQAALDTARSLAETFRRPLIVLHARSSAEAAASVNTVATTLEEFGIETAEHLVMRCIVKDGEPGDAIVEAIAQCRPSLLVAGVKRQSGTPGPHGTVFALLARSRVPVLMVPPARAVETAAQETECCSLAD